MFIQIQPTNLQPGKAKCTEEQEPCQINWTAIEFVITRIIVEEKKAKTR